MTTYDTIGTTYNSTRRPDPRIAVQIHTALGDAATVINVGAGTGSYEPPQTVLAVEPSSVMIAQRPAGSAPTLQAPAESIPVADDAADAVMALLTVHHWTDLAAGIEELRRIARRRIVILTWDQNITRRFWLLDEYLPEAAAFDDRRAVAVDRLVKQLGGARIETVPIPHDCTDGFGAAYCAGPRPISIQWCGPACQISPRPARRSSVRAWPGCLMTCPPAAGTSAMPTCSTAEHSTSGTGFSSPTCRNRWTA